jgi:hypothetical protein
MHAQAGLQSSSLEARSPYGQYSINREDSLSRNHRRANRASTMHVRPSAIRGIVVRAVALVIIRVASLVAPSRWNDEQRRRIALREAAADPHRRIQSRTVHRTQMTTDGTTYSFSVKDMVDACHFALFSDEQPTAAPVCVGRPVR